MAGLPPIQGTSAAAAPPKALGKAEAPGESTNLFETLLSKANEDQRVSDQGIQDLVTGKNDNVQEVVMQVVKSEMSFQLLMEVRNQLIESYNEMMRMQF